MKCSGGKTEDICQVCGGPGVTGCDQTCFSTKVYDSCGICGGNGPSGCDNQCGSTKTVGSCGVCGEAGNCTAPSPACNKLAFRSACPDLVCGYLNWGASNIDTVPSAEGAPSQTKSLEYTIRGMYGYYTVDVKESKVHIWVDALKNAGNAIQAAISYDWTGDSVWDRTEMYAIFTPNDLVGYELWESSALVSANGDWATLVNGTVRIQLWSAYPTTVPLYIMTDSGTQESYFTIPFITSYHGYNYTGTGNCGEIVIGPTTTISTSTSSTTSSSSTSGSTSGSTGSTSGTSGSTASTSSVTSGSTSSSTSSSTGSAPGTTGTTSGSTTGTTVNLCDNFECGCGNNVTCPCVEESTCQVVNGAATCVRTNKEDGTKCSVPSQCYEGVCASGRCVAQTDMNCDSNSNPGTVSSSMKIASDMFVIMAAIILLLQ